MKGGVSTGLPGALCCGRSSSFLSTFFTHLSPQLLFQMKGSHATLIKHLIEGRQKKKKRPKEKEKREGADVCQRGKDNSEILLLLLNESSQCCFLQ